MPDSAAARRTELLRRALVSHRAGLLCWSVGLTSVAWWFGTFYQDTISGPGGAEGFAAIARPTAEAMRPINGPAERLETYGGYFTYHNLGYVALFLALYAALQGARAVRGDEERGLADLWLSAGRARWTLVRDRVLAFAAVLTLIAATAGTGIGAGAVAAGSPDWTGAYAAMAEIALTAFVVYCIALVVSQLTRTARGAATITGFTLVLAYLVNNMSNAWVGFAYLRWLTPFAYLEQSRAFIPGQGVNGPATAVLVAAALALTGAAAYIYELRDSGAPLHARVEPEEPGHARIRTGRLRNRDLWLASLHEQFVGLAGWVALAGVLQWLYVSLGSEVIDAWSDNPLVRQMFLRIAPGSLTDQYISFTVIITAGIAVAFVIVQSARWIGDLRQGRDEMSLAHGVSRGRLVLERAASAATGVILIALAGAAGMVAGGLTSGLSINGGGVLRTAGATVLLGFGAGGVALLVVAWLRSSLAVVVLTVLLATSWLITLFGGIADLPGWLMRTSIFDAFGNPYISPLRTGSVVYLACLAVIGCATAMLTTTRRSSVAR